MTSKIQKIENGMILADRYQLKYRFAVGGMGELWVADDIKLNRQVAVKVIKSANLEDEKVFSRIEAEAKNNVVLSHPNIVYVYDYNIDLDVFPVPYIVMEYLKGLPLSTIIKNQNLAGDRQAQVEKLFLTEDQEIFLLDEYTVLNIMLQIAEALSYIHSKQIVHRDIKPSNIIIDSGMHVKLSDFGASRAKGQEDITSLGMVVGTAQYISPEQALGKTATEKSDIYSLGIIAYEMLVGERPFTGKTVVEIATAQVKEQLPPIDNTLTPVHEETVRLVEDMLAKIPELRPADSMDLINRIQKIIAKYYTNTGSHAMDGKENVKKDTSVSEIGSTQKPVNNDKANEPASKPFLAPETVSPATFSSPVVKVNKKIASSASNNVYGDEALPSISMYKKQAQKNNKSYLSSREFKKIYRSESGASAKATTPASSLIKYGKHSRRADSGDMSYEPEATRKRTKPSTKRNLLYTTKRNPSHSHIIEKNIYTVRRAIFLLVVIFAILAIMLFCSNISNSNAISLAFVAPMLLEIDERGILTSNNSDFEIADASFENNQKYGVLSNCACKKVVFERKPIQVLKNIESKRI